MEMARWARTAGSPTRHITSHPFAGVMVICDVEQLGGVVPWWPKANPGHTVLHALDGTKDSGRTW
jgi:hypothetical protein